MKQPREKKWKREDEGGGKAASIKNKIRRKSSREKIGEGRRNE